MERDIVRTPTRIGPAPSLLLIEDNEGDARLIGEAMRETGMSTPLSHVTDGEEAMAFLRREGAHADAARPSLILLDLNLPRMDGRETLRAIKSDPVLKAIPVIVFSTSEAEGDVVFAYQNHANSYVTKPLDFEGYLTILDLIGRFWLGTARLPDPEDA